MGGDVGTMHYEPISPDALAQAVADASVAEAEAEERVNDTFILPEGQHPLSGQVYLAWLAQGQEARRALGDATKQRRLAVAVLRAAREGKG